MKGENEMVKRRIIGLVLLLMSLILFLIQIPYGQRQADIKPPIIIVPGIMGSVLYNDNTYGENDRRSNNNKMDDGEKVWPNLQKIYEEDDDKHLDALKLKNDGKEPADPKYKIKVDDLVWAYDPNTIELKWWHKVLNALFGWLGICRLPEGTNIYGGLRDHLQTKKYAVSAFSYDWRKDIRASANFLADEIQKVYEKEGEKQVVIIAHSMGGLVSRYALHKKIKDAHKKVAKLITLGTPHLGAVDAYIPLWYGSPVRLLSPQKTKEIAANFPGLYQMLPNQVFFDSYGEIFWDGWVGEEGERKPERWVASLERTYNVNEESKLPNETLINDGREFWKELDAWDKLGWIADVDVYLIASSGLWTEAEIRLRSMYRYIWLFGKIKITDYSRSQYLGWRNGDKTVPLISAIGLCGTATDYHIKEVNHTLLPSNAHVLALIDAILRGDKELEAVPEEHRKYIHTEEQGRFPAKARTMITSWSPDSIDLDIFDSDDNHLGRSKNEEERERGSVDIDIPGSDYAIFDDTVNALVLRGGTYTIEVNSIGGWSVLTLELTEFDEEGEMKESITFQASIGPKTKGKIIYHRIAEDPQLKLDCDGDGNYETTVDLIPSDPFAPPPEPKTRTCPDP